MKRQILYFISVLIFLTSQSMAATPDSAPSQYSEVNFSPTEGNSNHIAYFLLQINAPLSSDVSVQYVTREGTAQADIDFISTSGTAIIPAGSTYTTIGVEIIGDSIFESNETFSLVISNPSGANFPNNLTEIVSTRTIVDDDSQTLSAAAAQWSEGACNDTTEVYTGATRDYYNRGARLAWRNFMGDWIDKNGTPQGNTPFAQITVKSLGKEQVIEADITEIAKKWHDNTLINQGVILINQTSGKFYMYTKESTSGTASKLLIETTEGSYSLNVVADSLLNSATHICSGQIPLLNAYHRILLRYDLSTVGGDILSAKMQIFTNNTQQEETRIDIFAVSVEPPRYDFATPANGIASNYPNDKNIEDSSQVYLATNFENSNWQNHWAIYSPDTISVVDEDVSEKFEPFVGKALKSTILDQTHTGLNMHYEFLENLGFEPDKAYFRYYLRFGDKWDSATQGKLPGLAGIYANTPNAGGWGGRGTNGDNGWSTRGTFNPLISEGNYLENRVPAGSYIYHADMTGGYGDEVIWNGDGLGYLQKNRWYSIEQFVQLNTPGNHDGALKVWVDGKPAYQRTGLRFTDNTEVKIETVWMNFYHGGVTPSDKDISIYIDNIVVASEYIGPMQVDSR